MWQALETKARFIGQVITGDNAARRAEDIGGQELSYAEVKAIASGNPAVLTLAEADAELQRLNLLKKNHLDEQYVARRSVRDLPGTIASLSRAAVQAHDGRRHRHGPCRRSHHHRQTPLVKRGRTRRPGRPARRTCPVTSAIPPACRSAPTGACDSAWCCIPQFPPDVYLEGAITAQSMLSRDHHGPRAVLNALERLATGYGSESSASGRTCPSPNRNCGIMLAQERSYEARVTNAAAS